MTNTSIEPFDKLRAAPSGVEVLRINVKRQMNVRLRRIIYIVLLFFVVFAFPSFAQDKDLIINADNVSYHQEKNIVEAEGSVEVIYQEVTIHGKHVLYNTISDEVFADGGFSLAYSGISIEGDSLEYYIKEKEGNASQIDFNLGNINLKGEKIQFGKDKFKLQEASFTTCNLEQAHYRLTASEITVYPDYGWMVAYWGYFWMNGVPVVPVPTYIYDLYAEEKGRKNLPPFPEISSNDEDGTYVRQRMVWHLKRELSGTYSLDYATKKGVGAGFDLDYIINESSIGNLRCKGNFVDGLGGGITHRLFFGGEIEDKRTTPLSFFTLPKSQQYELVATLSSRERINYEKVSYYPNLELKMRKTELFIPVLKYEAEAVLGMVGEENSLNLGRGGGKLGVYWEIPEQVIGFITPSFSQDLLFYSNGGLWEKTSAGLNVQKVFLNNILMGMEYLHYFRVNGLSPFNYEMYRFSSADRLKTNIFFLLGDTGVGFDTAYYLDTWQPEDIDYSLYFKMHCYNLLAKYRSLRGEFQLGFSLSGG